MDTNSHAFRRGIWSQEDTRPRSESNHPVSWLGRALPFVFIRTHCWSNWLFGFRVSGSFRIPVFGLRVCASIMAWASLCLCSPLSFGAELGIFEGEGEVGRPSRTAPASING